MVNDERAILRSLLLHDAEEKRKQRTPPTNRPSPNVTIAALRTFGVIQPNPSAGVPNHPFCRTVPSSLLSARPCPPISHLVAKRADINRSKVLTEEDATVEILLDDGSNKAAGYDKDDSVCDVSGNSRLGCGNAPRNRPLTSRLGGEGYAAGEIGTRRPFRAGGMDAAEEVKNTKGNNGRGRNEIINGNGGKDEEDKQDDMEEFRSPEECASARSALDSWRVAWKNGTLITSPPGATLDVGLSPVQVFRVDGDAVPEEIGEKGYGRLSQEGKDKDEKEREQGLNEDDEDSGNGTMNEAGGNTSRTHVVSPTTIKPIVFNRIWDKSFFDDDSLFDGTESSESDSDDGSDDGTGVGYNDNDDIDDDDDTNNDSDNDSDDSSENGSDSRSNKLVHKGSRGEVDGISTASLDADDDIDSVDDVDALLSELSLISAHSEVDAALRLRTKRSLAVGAASSLSFRKQREQEQQQQRKSWAVTTLLRIPDFHAAVPDPALEFPFELDPFQKQAVSRIERGENVFVAAHTSAGKTVCAEYAVALSRKHRTRCVYTSPIKALSNQKYRDFRERMGEDEVGLITGDMQINPDGSCLIMTTEILRSMLYRGADLVRDIEWVIFDEVHYVNDAERGVVWEEVIIMLPDYVRMVFLSATTPNTIEFSDWIGRTKGRPVHVIRTDYRPVPLSHHLWAGRKLHKIMEGRGGFLEKGLKAANHSMLPMSEQKKKLEKGNRHDQDQGRGKGGRQGGGGRSSQQRGAGGRHGSSSSRSGHNSWQQSGNRQDWTALVKYLNAEGLVPTVVFSFSKKKCEEIAFMLRTLDFNSSSERNAAHAFAKQAISRLSPRDAILPQVLSTCDMVKRGFGVHHGGLLPILKEMVEILFSRNLIKVLFATETFAMGVNMPARAVVFNSVRKHDGTQFRILESGEYTQMAGRAGRRGLDKVGTVILCCFGDEPPPAPILRKLLTGTSTKLKSQFRLRYNMILNLLRVEDMSVEAMIKRSFSEFSTQRALATNEYPRFLARGTRALAKIDAEFKEDVDTRAGCHDIEEYQSVSKKLQTLSGGMLSLLLGATGGTGTAGGALTPGRIILATSATKEGEKQKVLFVRAPALIIKSHVPASGGIGKNVAPNSQSDTKPSAGSVAHCVCIVLLPSSYAPEDGDDGNGRVIPISESSIKPGCIGHIASCRNRHYAIYKVCVDQILFVTDIKYKIDSSELYMEEQSAGVGRQDFPPKMTVSRAGKVICGKLRSDPFDSFSGMVATGKKGSMGSSSWGKSSPAERDSPQFGTSQSSQAFEKVMTYLIGAEGSEIDGSLGVLDLTECSRGLQHGFHAAVSQQMDLVTVLRRFQSHRHPGLEWHYVAVERRENLRATVETLRHLLSNQSLQLFPDFLQRKALLRTLNYIDDNDTVCVKGRVACEVNTCEELIVTELVFEGILNELEPAEIVASLSALIFQEKSGEEELDSELPERLVETCEKMKTITTNLGLLQKNHGLQIDPKDYCDSSLKFGLVHVVYEWALGVPFSNICIMTMVQEGSIVRCITRLDELCREVRNCARVVGNPTLYRKMEEASVAIKRDIVFASSLYVN